MANFAPPFPLDGDSLRRGVGPEQEALFGRLLSYVYNVLPDPPVSVDGHLCILFDTDGGGVDRLSLLPDVLLGNIVSRLPIKDAARTAVLSRRWRPVWRAAPLVLVDTHLLPAGEDQIPNHLDRATSSTVTAAVSRILATHPGPFRCVRLACCYMDEHRPKLARWLHLLADKGVQELFLINRPWPLEPTEPIPSTLFNMLDLACLYLSFWKFPDTARLPRVAAFPHLRELGLCTLYIETKDLEFVLSRSPVLEILCLQGLLLPLRFRLVSNSLRCLQIHACKLDSIVVVSAPRLERFLLPTIIPSNDLEQAIKIGHAPALRLFGRFELERGKLQVGNTIIKAGIVANPNEPGDMAFWDYSEKKLVAKTKAECSVTSEWSPDGRHFMTATTAPRLQIDNCTKIFDHNGSLQFKKMFERLYQVDWKPEVPERFGDIADLTTSLSTLKIEETKKQVGGKGRGCSIQGGEKMVSFSLQGYASPEKEDMIQRSTRRTQGSLASLPSSATTSKRVSNWSQEDKLLLYTSYLEEVEIEGSEELSHNAYMRIERKLVDKRANVGQIKQKLKNDVNNYTNWIKQGKQSDKAPDHLHLLERMFEHKEKAKIALASSKEALTALGSSKEEVDKNVMGLSSKEIEEIKDAEAELIDGVRRLCCAIDEQGKLIFFQTQERDDFDIEGVEQLESAYSLALAAAKANPTNIELMREAVKARKTLTAAVLRPD